MAGVIREIWTRKDLIRELVLKDLKLRYSRPALGFFWAFILPLVTVLIFYIVFSVFLRARTQEAPFVLYLMSAVFPWGFFCNSVIAATTSLVENKNLIRESRFPYYFLVLAVVLANLINFLPSLAVLIVAAGLIQRGLPGGILLLPLVLLVQCLITFSLALIFALFYVKYRDLKYLVEISLTILFNLTPGFYSIYLVKDALSPLLFKIYLYNPFTGILIFYRCIILKGFYQAVGNEFAWLTSAGILFCFAGAVLIVAFLLYRSRKNSINDYLSY